MSMEIRKGAESGRSGCKDGRGCRSSGQVKDAALTAVSSWLDR
jgi:hypothetical protein